MKKVLFVSNVLSHIHAFHLPYIKWFQDHGYEVHVMANNNGQQTEGFDRYYDVKIIRSPFSLGNIAAYRDAKRIIEEENYDVVHCHTPMGGVIGRLASKGIRKRGAKVLYTAHGFHFYNGAPLINWLLYYTMEKSLVKNTDAIVTINTEDHARLEKMIGKRLCRPYYVKGVGIDTGRFFPSPQELREQKKEANGYGGKILMFYAAEFIKRKNHAFLIENFAKVAAEYPNAMLLLAGKGPLQEKMEQLVRRLSLEDRVQFLGFRRDIPELLSMVDINLSTSLQEGLPINVVEGVASGCPELVSDIRGNIDLVQDGYNGFVYRGGQADDFCQKAAQLLRDAQLREQMSRNNLEQIKELDIQVLVEQMADIYTETLKESVHIETV